MAEQNGKRRVYKMPPLDFYNTNNLASLQTFIKSQIYFKGFKIPVNTGINADIPIQLGGSSKRLYGIVLYREDDTQFDTFSLTINNELIIDNVLWKSFYPTQTGNMKEQIYFEIPRPLSGSDDTKITWNALNNSNVYAIFYLSNTVDSNLKTEMV